MPGVVHIPAFSRLTGQVTSERLQDQIESWRQGFSNGMADGCKFQINVSTAQATGLGAQPRFSSLVNHPLGRTPQLVVAGAGNWFGLVAVDPTQPNGIDNTKKIRLIFQSFTPYLPAEVSIWLGMW
jgi:hypothetical protein